MKLLLKDVQSRAKKKPMRYGSLFNVDMLIPECTTRFLAVARRNIRKHNAKV